MQFDRKFNITGYAPNTLRYGENPHQQGALYSTQDDVNGFLGGDLLLTGKVCSLVNVLDIDAAFRAAALFQHPSVCIVKHASPCGIASATSVCDAYKAAHDCDKRSALGGVIAANCTVTMEMAEAIARRFVECIVAPDFEDGVVDALRKNDRKEGDRRVLKIPLHVARNHTVDYRSVLGGFLVQTVDKGDPVETAWKVVSKRQPTHAESEAMTFAWKACQPVLSNAIVLAQGTATVGIGGGQPNRIDCVEIAIRRSEGRCKGAVMASDSFFPFDDCVRMAAENGVTAVIFQGGGQQDPKVIDACDELGIALVKTNVRHFRH